MNADQGPFSAPRRLTSHQRSSSTGSHALLFSGHQSNLGHNSLFVRQSQGSPDLLTDDDEDGEGSGGFVIGAAELQGTLSKWTNYIHGWQDRYIVLKDGSLVYYKSEIEMDFGCRGAISIVKGTVEEHELDNLRFDVSVSDCVWYLRAKTVEGRQRWIDAIEGQKKYHLHDMNNATNELSSHITPSSVANSSQQLHTLKRHDSALSLTSTASKGGFSRNGQHHHRGLTEKLAEMETFRDILCRQIDSLQGYFDACADVGAAASLNYPKAATAGDCNGDAHAAPATKEVVEQHGIHSLDFKGEAITFKATTAGILATMSHCIDIMNQRENQWRRKLEREQTTRKRLEEKLKDMDKDEEVSADTPSSKSKMVMVGPDYEEGPHSQIGEDEFFDAVENALDKLQEEQDYRDKMKLMSEKSVASLEPEISEATQHQLWPTIDKVTREQLHYARMKVGEGVWELFAEDGEMRMYKREEEVDGLVVDPLKALHSVRGVTARELCHYFFAPEVRMEWETTVEQVTVLEKIAPDTLIFLQLHKRVWPTAQRDALFWSHMRHVASDRSGVQVEDGRMPNDVWMVCNQSTKHPDAPENQGGCVRVGLTVCFVCDTYIDPPFTKETACRNNLSTKITYCSVVNPGGWVPATVLRAVFKREYPRFLKRFTQYVMDKSKNNRILW